MNTQNGFTLTAAMLLVAALFAVAGVAYILLRPASTESISGTPSVSEETSPDSRASAPEKTSIVWEFVDAGEVDYIPYTQVSVLVNGVAYDTGKHTGACSEIGESGGFDGKGLVAGELSAVQCYFAGGGDEIGVFANEDGGLDIMQGELSEGTAQIPPFRGDFKVKNTIK